MDRIDTCSQPLAKLVNTVLGRQVIVVCCLCRPGFWRIDVQSQAGGSDLV